MRIRIRRAIAGIIDGVSLSHFVPGLSYDVSDSLGGYLVSTRDADVVAASATVTEPDEERTDYPVFGGVIVNARESAADGPRPERRRRKRR